VYAVEDLATYPERFGEADGHTGLLRVGLRDVEGLGEESQQLPGPLERQRIGRGRVALRRQQRGERLANSRRQLDVGAIDGAGLEEPRARGEGIDRRIDAAPAERGRQADDDVGARQLREALRGPLSPLEIIRSATVVGAELLGLPGELGTVAPDAFADLLIVDGDPLRDLSLLQGPSEHLSLIMKAGALYKNRLTGS
jgi:Amidohydrolase family